MAQECPDVPIKTQILIGKPFQVIMQWAEEIKPSLLVIARHGAGEILKLTLRIEAGIIRPVTEGRPHQRRPVAHGQLNHVVGRDLLEKGQRVPALDRHPAHVAHVEEADVRPDRPVLFDHATVLDRHLPAGEFHQLAARLLMLREEGGSLHDLDLPSL